MFDYRWIGNVSNHEIMNLLVFSIVSTKLFVGTVGSKNMLQIVDVMKFVLRIVDNVGSQ